MNKALAALTTLALALGACSGSESLDKGKSSAENPTSSLQMNLTLPGGLTINTVNYSVTGGPSSITRNGPINVQNSSVLRFRVGNLPVGPGYTMNLGGTTTSGVSCAGTQTFAIADNLVTTITMTLTCGTGVQYEVDSAGDVSVSVDVVSDSGPVCPVVTGITALPLETAVNSSVSLEGFVTSTTGATLSWTGAGGTFSAASAAASDFTCTSAGDKTLTFAVNKAGCNASSQDVVVTCTGTVEPPVDSGVEPPVDSGVTPPVDSGVEPPVDSGVTPPVDSGVTPPVDNCATCIGFNNPSSVCRDYQGSGVDIYAACYEAADPVFAQRCVDAYECSVQATDSCAGDLTRGAVSCYCGLSKSINDCFAPVGSTPTAGPAGACIPQWEAATQCAAGNNTCVSNNFVAQEFPSGTAAFLVSCAVNECAASCTLPRPAN